MTGKSDRSLWAVSQKTPCCLAERRKEALAAAREPRALLTRLQRLCGLPAAGAAGATGATGAAGVATWEEDISCCRRAPCWRAAMLGIVWMNWEGRREMLN